MRARAGSILSRAGLVAIGFGAATMMGLGSWQPADADKGEAVAIDAVPAAVKRAIEAHAPGATLLHARKLVENDSTFYAVKGKAKDEDRIEFKTLESGRLVEVMHDMSPDKLPADVVERVKELVPGGQIVVGERHMAIRWRLEVKDGAKVKEVVLRADGKHAIFDKATAAPKPATK